MGVKSIKSFLKSIMKSSIASKRTSVIGTTFRVGTKNLEAREVWLEKALSQIPEGMKILDAGAGELQYKKFCTHLNYVSQDFGQYDGQGTQEGLQTKTWDNSKLDIVSDIIDIPVPDKSFDAIMCIEVFEHIPQPALAVKEFSRIIKPGGTLIITAPFCSLTHFAPYHFGTGYTKYWYQHVLAEHGFTIKEMTPNGNYFEYLGQEIRRIDDFAQKFCKYKLNHSELRQVQNLLPILQKLTDIDQGSEELLNFGYHVIAYKN